MGMAAAHWQSMPSYDNHPVLITLLRGCRGFEDAYEDADDGHGQDGPGLRGKGSKRRKGASKAAARRKPARRAPQIDQAEAILAAGSNALYMHDTAQGGPAAVEVADAPVPQASEPQPQEPQSEIF